MRLVSPRAQELLDNDKGLREVVSEAVLELRKAFGDAPIEVDYFDDHEDHAPAPHIIVTVLPRCPFDEAHERMRCVDERWLFANMHRADGRFSLEVHPVACSS